MNFLGRPSLSQNTSFQAINRRSSLAGVHKSKSQGEYRKEKDVNLRLLHEFLTENNFPDEVSNRTLKAPATNYVKNIFLFIINKLNPRFTDFRKFEVDVKNYLDIYGYPYSFSKTYLQAPGTPNSWPCVLASICWLVNVYQTVDANYEEEEMFGKSIKKFEITPDLYRSFLDGADMAEIKEKVQDDNSERINGRKSEIAEIHEQMEADQGEIEMLQENSEYQAELNFAKKLERDSQNFDKLIQRQKQHINSNIEGAHECKQKSKILDKNLEEIKIQTEFAGNKLEKQTVSVEDVNKIKAENKNMRRDLAELRKEKREWERKLSKAKERRLKHQSRLELGVKKLDAILRKIGVSPQDAKLAYGNDFTLKFDPALTILENQNVNDNMRRLVSVDLKKGLKKHLMEVYMSLNNEKSEMGKRIAQLEAEKGNLSSGTRLADTDKQSQVRKLGNMRGQNQKKSEMLEMKKSKMNDEFFTKTISAYNSQTSQDSFLELAAKLKEAEEREKVLLAEVDKKYLDKEREVCRAMLKYKNYISLRVEEYKNLQKLADKLNLLFPRIK